MITTQQMRELEDKAYARGISVQELMENAGRAVFEVVRERYILSPQTCVVIFAGQGNNGGDGFVAARYFAEYCPVIVLFFGEKGKLLEGAAENYDRILKKVTVVKIKNNSSLEKFQFQKDFELILIDALLGTGLQGPIREPLASGIDFFNALPGVKVAVDVPSGVNSDTGEVQEKSCQVDVIVSFHDVKTGLAAVEELREKTVVVDIGILV